MPRLPLPALLLATSLLSAPVFAQAPLTLDQVMADPDWIGPPVEDFWWSWDGRHAQYALKREGATIRDTWQVAVGIGGSGGTGGDGGSVTINSGGQAQIGTAGSNSIGLVGQSIGGGGGASRATGTAATGAAAALAAAAGAAGREAGMR